ncbi:MAG: hypothetical protein ACYC5Q_02255 [Thermoleophilia bacterium]
MKLEEEGMAMQPQVCAQTENPGGLGRKAATRETVRPDLRSCGEPAVASEDREHEDRREALAAISDDPVVQSFYDRVVPAGVVPAAWMPFWPGAWRGGEGDI